MMANHSLNLGAKLSYHYNKGKENHTRESIQESNNSKKPTKYQEELKIGYIHSIANKKHLLANLTRNFKANTGA